MSKDQKVSGRVLGVLPFEWLLVIAMLSIMAATIWWAAKKDHLTETFDEGYVGRADVYEVDASLDDAERVFGILGPEMRRCHTYSYFALRFQVEGGGQKLDDEAIRTRGSQSFDACMSAVLDHVSGVVEDDIVQKLRLSLDCKSGCEVPVIPGASPWKAG